MNWVNWMYSCVRLGNLITEMYGAAPTQRHQKKFWINFLGQNWKHNNSSNKNNKNNNNHYNNGIDRNMDGPIQNI